MTGNLINNYASFTSFARNQSLQTVILQRRGNTMDAVVAPCVSPLTGKGRFSVAKRFRCGAAVPPGARSTRSKRGGTSSCLNPAVAGRLRPPPPGRRGRLQTSPCVHQGRRSPPPRRRRGCCCGATGRKTINQPVSNSSATTKRKTWGATGRVDCAHRLKPIPDNSNPARLRGLPGRETRATAANRYQRSPRRRTKPPVVLLHRAGQNL